VVDLVRHFLSTEFANPSEGRRTTAARVQRSQRVNRRSSACGFMDGGRGEKSVKPSEVSPPTTPQAQQQQQSCMSMRCNLQPPTRSLKEAKTPLQERITHVLEFPHSNAGRLHGGNRSATKSEGRTATQAPT